MSRQTAFRSVAAAAAALILAVLIDARPWRWALWRNFASAVADHLVLTVIGLPATVVLLVAAVALLRDRRRTPGGDSAGHPRRWHWLLSYPGVMAVAVGVAAVGVIAFFVMLAIADGTTATERPKLQIDAIKYGLGFFAAAGAAAALLLGVRRQQHTEDAQAHTELDAAERRITDIFTKAVEQIGSTNAAVRLGGLYALERVAQNNPGQRQTIVNVLCAYLRMPYVAPSDWDAATNYTSRTATERLIAVEVSAGEGRDAHQELQVRLTAQRILTAHLTLRTDTRISDPGAVLPDPQQPFWPGLDLDLTGATLVAWKLNGGHVRNAEFGKVTFVGLAEFGRATFTGTAYFGGAVFKGAAVFKTVAFTEGAWFRAATFTRGVWFDRATFQEHAGFRDGSFMEIASFRDVTFAGDTHFHGATFARRPILDRSMVIKRDIRNDEWPAEWHVERGTDADRLALKPSAADSPQVPTAGSGRTT